MLEVLSPIFNFILNKIKKIIIFLINNTSVSQYKIFLTNDIRLTGLPNLFEEQSGIKWFQPSPDRTCERLNRDPPYQI
jgi:hypothetical protein